MTVSCVPVPVTTGPCEVCYACQRHFAPNTMGGCMECGEDLCLDYPTCPGLCRCDVGADSA